MKQYQFGDWKDIIRALNDLNHSRNGIYKGFKPLPEGHIFDEDQSVRWNRERVAEYNKDAVLLKNQALDRQNEEEENCKQQILEYIQKECECTPEQAEIIHGRLYSEDAVYDAECANDILYFCYKLLNAAS